MCDSQTQKFVCTFRAHMLEINAFFLFESSYPRRAGCHIVALDHNDLTQVSSPISY